MNPIGETRKSIFSQTENAPGRQRMQPIVHQHAERIASHFSQQGRKVSAWHAMGPAYALAYLARREVRMPVTLEQAKILDSRERYAAKSYWAGLEKLADGEERAKYARILVVLNSIEEPPEPSFRFSNRAAPGPICGWWPTGPRGAYSGAHWRRTSSP